MGGMKNNPAFPVPRLALALLCLSSRPLAASASPAPKQPSVRIDAAVAVTSAAAADGSLRLQTRSLDARLWVDQCVPQARLGLQAPFLTLGSVRPAGLAAFLYRPAGAGLVLLREDGPMLKLENPKYARYGGLVVGDDFGLFALVPNSQPDRSACGAWISPRGGFLSLLAAGAREPAEGGGPGWYDPPSPADGRLWTAGGLGGSSARLDWALAAAATSGYPGPDAGAGRAEGRLSLGHLRLTGAASATGASWRAPDGADASALRLDIEARYARRGFAATAGWRVTEAEAATQATNRYAGSIEFVGSTGRLYVAVTVTPDPAGGRPDATVATSWRPGFAPWAYVSTSWAADSGQARRFDVLADVRLVTIAVAGADEKAGVALGGGVSFLPDGMSTKLAASAFLPFGPVVVELGAKTADWTSSRDSLIDALVYTVTARGRFDFTSPGK